MSDIDSCRNLAGSRAENDKKLICIVGQEIIQILVRINAKDESGSEFWTWTSTSYLCSWNFDPNLANGHYLCERLNQKSRSGCMGWFSTSFSCRKCFLPVSNKNCNYQSDGCTSSPVLIIALQGKILSEKMAVLLAELSGIRLEALLLLILQPYYAKFACLKMSISTSEIRLWNNHPYVVKKTYICCVNQTHIGAPGSRNINSSIGFASEFL